MAWVNTSYQFGHCIKKLFLPRAEIATNREVFDFLRELEDSPVAMEQAIQSIIDRFRPDLKGGVVEAMHFNISRGEWEFLYTHSSFERTASFEEFPREPIIQVKVEAVP